MCYSVLVTDLHPSGYGTQLLTLPQLIARHTSGCEPETVLRVIEFLHGQPELGIGGGWRPCPSDTSDASLACKSFHQTQRFAPTGPGQPATHWFCAFDFVRRNPLSTPSNPKPHISLRPGDLPYQASPQASLPPTGLGLHANVGTPGTPGFEPWHGQPSEIDGFDSWVQAGRKRPNPIMLTHFPPKPPPNDFYDLRTTMTLSTLHPLDTPQRFFDTRGFGGPVAAGEYEVLPPYPSSNLSPPMPTLDDGTPIRGVAVTVKIITPTFTGFAAAYSTRGNTPGTSILDFPPDAPGNPPAYNAQINLPVTPDVGAFYVFINVPAHIVIDLYGYWT